MEYDIIEYISLFFVYGFFGWCAEVIFAALKDGRFVNRGFLNGPICPIYGLGLVFVLMLLEPLKDNILLIFTGSVAITTLLELLVGLMAEKLLDQRLWDYSNEPFNFRGLVCLRFSIMWGIGAMMIVCIIHPVIMRPIDAAPRWLLCLLCSLAGAFMIVDIVITTMEAARIPRRKRAAREIERIIGEFSEEIGENISDGAIKLSEKYDELKKLRDILDEKQGMVSRRFARAFPHIDRSGYRRRLEEVKARCDEFVKKHIGDRK